MTGRGAEQVSAAELGRKPGVLGRAVIGWELAQGLALALWASLHLLHLKRWHLNEPPWPPPLFWVLPPQRYRQPQRDPRSRACLPACLPASLQSALGQVVVLAGAQSRLPRPGARAGQEGWPAADT